MQVDYESLDGTGKSSKVRELVLLMQRSGRVSELIDACRRYRPQLQWPDLDMMPQQDPGAGIPAKSSSSLPNKKPAINMPPANPFTYGNPISDLERFFGRDRIIEQLFSRLRNAEHESSSLVGGRRIGKTSLLNYLSNPEVRLRYGLDPEQYIFIFVDLQMVDSSITPARLWERLLQQIARHCRDDELKHFTRDTINVGSFDSFALADLFDVIDQRRQHIVFLLDEFENVTGNTNFGPDFFYALRSLAIQHNLSLITSSDRELIELTHSDAVRSSPFFNIFANIYVRLFSEAEARSFLEDSLEGSDISFSNEEIDFLLQTAGRHPFFLQSAVHILYEHYQQRLDAASRISSTMTEFSKQAAPHLEHYWTKSSQGEQIVLFILAISGRDEAGSSYGISPQRMSELYTQTGRLLGRLDQRSFVSSSGERHSLFGKIFGQWIVQEMTDTAGLGEGSGVWLQTNHDSLNRLPAEIQNELNTMLPSFNNNYWSLLLEWLIHTQDVQAVMTLINRAII